MLSGNKPSKARGITSFKYLRRKTQPVHAKREEPPGWESKERGEPVAHPLPDYTLTSQHVGSSPRGSAAPPGSNKPERETPYDSGSRRRS